jgi:hypothetical protein
MKFFHVLAFSIFSIFSPLPAEEESIDAKDLSLKISKESVDVIIYFEVGARSYYDKAFAKPMVPAWRTTASGVTIGIGADLGYMSHAQIQKAFGEILNDRDIKLLQSVSGMKGKNAYYNGLPKVKNNIYIGWDDAYKVFINYTLPSFTKQAADAFNLAPNRLHPHSNGALTSLVYNRGGSLANTDSRREMRQIKYNISVNREDKVPSDITSMKRLWSYSKLRGLHKRRDAEADLFQRGLDERKTKH